MPERLEYVSDESVQSWIIRLGSTPVETVAHADCSEPYVMREAHVLRLENNQYALVVEEGCSCYLSEEAEIELFPNMEAAMVKFQEWNRTSGKIRYA